MNDFLTLRELACSLKVSPRQIRRMVLEQRIPKPVYIGRFPRWPADTIEGWTAAGCPDAQTFAALKKGGVA